MAGIVTGLLLFALGLRVLARAARSRGLEESLVGVWFVTCGLGVIPIRMVALPGSVDPQQVAAWLGPAQVLVTLGFSALAVFVWRTFGADTWRRPFALVLIALQWLSLAVLGALDGFTAMPPPFLLVVAALRTLALVWAFAETARYARMMARRVPLGLADPVVANRIMLWAIWTGGFGIAMTGILVLRVVEARFLAGASALDPATLGPVVIPVLACMALAGAGAMLLAFFPPAMYRRWIAARATVVAAAPQAA